MLLLILEFRLNQLTFSRVRKNLFKKLPKGLRFLSPYTSSMSTKFSVLLICVYAGKIAAAARWLRIFRLRQQCRHQGPESVIGCFKNGYI
jgi:hypothetical protein